MTVLRRRPEVLKLRTRIALVHGNDGTDVRIGKTCRSLSRLGFETHFVGWDRRPDACKERDLGAATAHVMTFATPNGRGNLAGQVRFIGHVARTLKEVRPDVVCAVNEELAFAVLPFKGRYYDRLVCDVFDSLAARATTRAWYERLPLRLVHSIGSYGADRLIATDEYRLRMMGQFAKKAVVVENVPEDPGEELSHRLPEGPVKIWAAGSIERSKGFGQLLEAIEPLSDVEIVSAGWPYDGFATDVFLKHPRVRFHGIVTAQRALELAASCDAVFCYYEPVHEYRTNASPNKVYDAMAVGRPVLMNREVRLAEWVESEGIGDVCNYSDVVRLRRIVAGLAARRSSLEAFATRVRALFLERYTWSLVESRLVSLYGEPMHGLAT